VWQLDGQSLCVCVCVWQLDGQSVPLEVHLLKLVDGVDGVVQLLDYFDKPDSFVVVVDRRPYVPVVNMLLLRYYDRLFNHRQHELNF